MHSPFRLQTLKKKGFDVIQIQARARDFRFYYSCNSRV